MAAKIMRSLRLSEDVIKLIESQPGGSFTEQFETLIKRAYQDLPKALIELEKVDILIKQKKDLCVTLYDNLSELRAAASSIDSDLSRVLRVMPNLEDAFDTIVEHTSEVLHDL